MRIRVGTPSVSHCAGKVTFIYYSPEMLFLCCKPSDSGTHHAVLSAMSNLSRLPNPSLKNHLLIHFYCVGSSTRPCFPLAVASGATL